MTALAAVRIDPDGTKTNLHVPDSGFGPSGRVGFLQEELGGWPEFAHYGQPGGPAITVIVHEEGARSMPDNPLAGAFVEHVRGGPLSYGLHGPVIVLGHGPGGQLTTLTDLPESLREVLHRLAAKLEVAS